MILEIAGYKAYQSHLKMSKFGFKISNKKPNAGLPASVCLFSEHNEVAQEWSDISGVSFGGEWCAYFTG